MQLECIRQLFGCLCSRLHFAVKQWKMAACESNKSCSFILLHSGIDCRRFAFALIYRVNICQTLCANLYLMRLLVAVAGGMSQGRGSFACYKEIRRSHSYGEF